MDLQNSRSYLIWHAMKHKVLNVCFSFGYVSDMDIIPPRKTIVDDEDQKFDAEK